MPSEADFVLVRSIGISSLFLHTGASHLYLLDFNGENLPGLKKLLEEKYPDVKVCRAP